MDRYGDRVKALAEKVSTFRALLAKWEQINEPPPKPEDQKIGGYAFPTVPLLRRR
jgi:hypothetical protein